MGLILTLTKHTNLPGRRRVAFQAEWHLCFVLPQPTFQLLLPTLPIPLPAYSPTAYPCCCLSLMLLLPIPLTALSLLLSLPLLITPATYLYLSCRLSFLLYFHLLPISCAAYSSCSDSLSLPFLPLPIAYCCLPLSLPISPATYTSHCQSCLLPIIPAAYSSLPDMGNSSSI